MAKGVFRSIADYVSAWAAEHWIEIIIGASGVIVATVARFSKILAPFGALGWIGAGLATLAVLSLIHAVYSWASDRAADRDYKRLLSALPTTVNPLAMTFENQRIRIADFFHPMAQLHVGKTFRRCQFVGPGAIAIMSHSQVFHARWTACDIVAVNRVSLRTAAGFERTVFDECQFINVILFIPRGMVETFLAENKSAEPVQIIGYNDPTD